MATTIATTAQQAYDEIVVYIRKFSSPYNSWYAGIASDVRQRLFTDHRVLESSGAWIYITLSSETDARNVEKALLNLGCDGGGGGGDRSTTQVYAYLKTPQTRP